MIKKVSPVRTKNRLLILITYAIAPATWNRWYRKYNTDALTHRRSHTTRTSQLKSWPTLWWCVSKLSALHFADLPCRAGCARAHVDTCCASHRSLPIFVLLLARISLRCLRVLACFCWVGSVGWLFLPAAIIGCPAGQKSDAATSPTVLQDWAAGRYESLFPSAHERNRRPT